MATTASRRSHRPVVIATITLFLSSAGFIILWQQSHSHSAPRTCEEEISHLQSRCPDLRMIPVDPGGVLERGFYLTTNPNHTYEVLERIDRNDEVKWQGLLKVHIIHPETFATREYPFLPKGRYILDGQYLIFGDTNLLQHLAR